MRFSLLLLGLLSSAAAQAQLLPNPAMTPGTAPGLLTPQLGPLAPQARTSASVTLPERIVGYPWNASSRVWALPTIGMVTYNANGQPLVEVDTDSLTQVPKDRSTYTYTAAGLQSSSQYETWNGSFTPVNLDTYTYDTQGHLTAVLSQQWQNGAWQNKTRDVNTYDAQGNQTESISYTWRNNAWVIAYAMRTTYVYTTGGSVQELVMARWNLVSASYETQQRILYTYGANPQQWLTLTNQSWANGVYTNTGRSVNPQYDAQGRQTYVENETWISGAWQPASRNVMTYAAGGPGYVFVMQNWANGAWTNSGRYTAGYDAQGNQVTDMYEEWRNNAWVPSSGRRYLLRYTAANVLDQRVVQNVDYTSGAFVNAYKLRYGNFRTITATQPAARLLAATSLFPNPTSTAEAPTLRIEGLREQAPATVAVLNGLGQVVHSQRVRVQQGRLEQRLELRALPAGLYTVRVQTAEGTVAKSLVRQ